MAARFGELPEALSATLRVAEICDVEIDAGTVRMPKLERGLGQSAAALLAEKVAAGLRRRLGDAGEDTGVKGVSIYEERVRRELTVIEEVGFTDYFLVVADYVRWAREAGVPVGPGRGSVGGSVVAWALRITEIDPIRHGLLFERFMNAERANAPVISVDLCPVRRLEVADYISRRHGIEKVAWVGEHEEILGGALVGDVADALGMSGARIERIRDLVPSHRWSSVRYASEHDEELRDLVSRDAAYARLLALADQLWGLYRGPTAHPPNLVISDEPLAGIVPATRDVRGLLTTQYGRYDVEDLGFFPLELLGLEVLTVLDHAEKLVRQGPVPRFCLESIPLDGEEAFELISSGDTGDIFQVGSAGFRELLAWLQPSCFEDLCAAVALYRPGGLGSGMLADFGKRKRGEAEVLYPHPILEGCLKETYGVMVYQEQVMRAVVEVAGFTMDGADLLRRALGTKKADDVEKMRCLFLEGAAERGLGAGEAGEIFSALEHYAGYGFNKAHSVAYCLLTYRCAYLKAHFPDLYSEAVERCASGPSSG